MNTTLILRSAFWLLLLGFALALGAGWVLLEHFAPEVLDYVLKHTLTVLRSLATFAVRAIGAV